MTDYVKMANDFAEKHGVTLTTIGKPEYRPYFDDEKECRYVFCMQLERNNKFYSFTFGQSIIEDKKVPDMYSILACLTKYEVGTYENFLSGFGYKESKSSELTYLNVVDEYENVERLFGDIMEELQEIR